MASQGKRSQEQIAKLTQLHRAAEDKCRKDFEIYRVSEDEKRAIEQKLAALQSSPRTRMLTCVFTARMGTHFCIAV